jgi:hypothetical protein
LVNRHRGLHRDPFLMYDDLVHTKKPMAITFTELQEIYKEAREIFKSSISWKAKYDLIFSDRISKKVSFDWYDPDTSYEEDVTYFMMGFDSYMNEMDT